MSVLLNLWRLGLKMSSSSSSSSSSRSPLHYESGLQDECGCLLQFLPTAAEFGV